MCLRPLGLQNWRSQKHYPWCCTGRHQPSSKSVGAPPSLDHVALEVLQAGTLLLVPSTGVVRGYSLTFIFQQHCDQDCYGYDYLLFEGMVYSFYFLAFWSCDVWLSPTFWLSEWYGISVLHISVWVGGGGKHFLVAIFVKYHLRYGFTFFLMQ